MDYKYIFYPENRRLSTHLFDEMHFYFRVLVVNFQFFVVKGGQLCLLMLLKNDIYGKVVAIPSQILSSDKGSKRFALVWALPFFQQSGRKNRCFYKTMGARLMVQKTVREQDLVKKAPLALVIGTATDWR